MDLDSEQHTPAIDTQTSPITAQQALGDLGVQGTTVPVRVNDPSPISLEQPGTLANTTTSSDTILGHERSQRVADVTTEKTRELTASERVLRMPSQSLEFPVASLSSPTSTEAATARGAVQPEEAETPLSAFGPRIQELRPHPFEALLRTAPHPCYRQDLLSAVCQYLNYSPRLHTTDIDDLVTFNDDG